MTTVIAGVYKQSGLPDEIVPVKVAADGTLVSSGGGGCGGGTSDTTEATQLLVKNAVQNIDADVGSPADAVASTDTGTFSIIALIKRGLQNWTNILSRIPSGLGSKVSNNSFPVVIASDQSSVPVLATARNCTGRQTIALSASTVTNLTIPGGSAACQIQADGNTIRITQNATDPSTTVGTRIDDGVIYFVDTSLSNVRLFATTACNAQVCYFDKA